MPPEDLARARRWLYEQKCLGVENMESDEARIQVRAYFESKRKMSALRQSLAKAFPDIASFESTTIGLAWDRDAGSDFVPFSLTDDIWVFPVQGDFPAQRARARERIVLKPGAVFGSGRHETTQLVAQLMTFLDHRPATLLDVGAGTGILSLLAKKLGIESVDAVEISPEARRAAQKNFRLNECPDIRMYRDLKRIPGTYDVLLANLLTPTIIELKKDILARLEPGGRLLLSGIAAGEAEDVRDRFHAMRLEKLIQKGDWVGMLLRNPT